MLSLEKTSHWPWWLTAEVGAVWLPRARNVHSSWGRSPRSSLTRAVARPVLGPSQEALPAKENKIWVLSAISNCRPRLLYLVHYRIVFVPLRSNGQNNAADEKFNFLFQTLAFFTLRSWLSCTDDGGQDKQKHKKTDHLTLSSPSKQALRMKWLFLSLGYWKSPFAWVVSFLGSFFIRNQDIEEGGLMQMSVLNLPKVKNRKFYICMEMRIVPYAEKLFLKWWLRSQGHNSGYFKTKTLAMNPTPRRYGCLPRRFEPSKKTYLSALTLQLSTWMILVVD